MLSDRSLLQIVFITQRCHMSHERYVYMRQDTSFMYGINKRPFTSYRLNGYVIMHA